MTIDELQRIKEMTSSGSDTDDDLLDSYEERKPAIGADASTETDSVSIRRIFLLFEQKSEFCPKFRNYFDIFMPTWNFAHNLPYLQTAQKSLIFLIKMSCWPLGMTEVARPIQLPIESNLVPAFFGPSKMNAYTITNKCKASINWFGYLIITWIITSYLESFYRHG